MVHHKLANGHLFIATEIINGAKGSGLSPKLSIAKKKAFSEAVERLHFTQLRKKIKNCSSASLAKKSIRHFSPASFKLYLNEQIGLYPKMMKNFKSTEKFDWVLCEEGSSKRKTLVPSEFMQSRHSKSVPGFLFSTSGNAAHPKKTDATISSLLELIERDAFMFMWRAKLPPTELKGWRTSAPILSGVYKGYKVKLKPRFFLLRTDFDVYVVVAIHFDDNLKICPFLISAAADLDVNTAILRAGIELVQGAEFVLNHDLKRLHYSKNLDRAFMLFEDRCLFFAKNNIKSKIRFILDTKNDVNTKRLLPKAQQDSDSKLNFLLSEMDKVKARFFIYHAKYSVQKTVHFRHIVRVFSPDLLHIDYIHSHRMLGQFRYGQLARKFGLKKTFQCMADFNNYPHPFP